MSDLQQYIEKRKEHDPTFANGFELAMPILRSGVLLRQAREASGLTQEQVALQIGTQKSTISRIENHAENITLAALKAYAQAVGYALQIQLVTVEHRYTMSGHIMSQAQVQQISKKRTHDSLRSRANIQFVTVKEKRFAVIKAAEWEALIEWLERSKIYKFSKKATSIVLPKPNVRLRRFKRGSGGYFTPLMKRRKDRFAFRAEFSCHSLFFCHSFVILLSWVDAVE